MIHVLIEYQSVATPSALSAVIECEIFLQAWVQGSIGCKCGESGGLMGFQWPFNSSSQQEEELQGHASSSSPSLYP